MLDGGRGLGAVIAGDSAASLQWTAVCCRGDGGAFSSRGADVLCPTGAVVAAGTAPASAAGESAAGAAGCSVVVAAAYASSRTCSRLAMMSTFLTFACRSCRQLSSCLHGLRAVSLLLSAAVSYVPYAGRASAAAC